MAAVHSMTGFSNVTCESPLGTVMLELRSVNSRFLDLSVRIADDLRQFEPLAREAVSAKVARGKVEVRMGVQRQPAAEGTRLNLAIVRQLRGLGAAVRDGLPEAQPLSVADVLAWPGVLDIPAVDPDAVRAAVQAGLAQAVEDLQKSRAREGAELARLLLARCADVDAIAERLRARLPELRQALERKLVERLNQALLPTLSGVGSLSAEDINERIRQEVTLYALRADVDEELARLATHVAEVRRVLAAGGTVGRRLDFLMQELNREANTLGSKATAVDLTQAAVELKLLIEQMREQIQNLE
jgi:uncharacterized protein (TIGR00255 family)